MLEERIDAELALGAHADLVAELDALAAAQPLRERLQAPAPPRALPGGPPGRRARPLPRAGALLRDEHGLEPGAALRELERAILRQDPALDRPRASRRGSARRRARPRASRVADRRLVSVVYVELDELAGRDGELDPERLRVIQRRIFDEIARLFKRHGGVPEVLPGDAALAAFGIDQAHEDDAARAIRAALRRRGRVARAVAPFGTSCAPRCRPPSASPPNELVTGEDGVRGAQRRAGRGPARARRGARRAARRRADRRPRAACRRRTSPSAPAGRTCAARSA